MNRRRLILLGAGSLLGGLGGLLCWGSRSPLVVARLIQARAAAMGSRYGIRIGYGPPESFFVPPYPAEAAQIKSGVATQVALAALPAALDGIDQALPSYPPGFFSRLCKAIFLCGSLTLDGAEAGGTYGHAWIILVATSAVGNAGIFETARLGVHHEFSSLVWNRIPALPARWTALLPPGWTPARDNAQALEAPDHGAMPLADGFLSPYGATTAENDFNVYAETLFTAPRRIVELGKRHDRFARKAALLMAAYTLLDARMAVVFQNLGLAELRDAIPVRLEDGAPIVPIIIPRGEITPP